MQNQEPNLTQNALNILKERYLLPKETPSGLFRRVAKHTASIEEESIRKEWEDKFYQIMFDLDFLPNSPVLFNYGTENPMGSACYKIPVSDSMNGIFDAIKRSAIIFKMGGGCGFNFSNLRHKGDYVGNNKGVSSGPISFMSVFNTATGVVAQAGKRRGAAIAILNVDHPDIMEFIKCKSVEGDLSNFNISVSITDKFLEAVEKDEKWALISPRTGETVKELKAQTIFNSIVDGIYQNGEPGIFFVDEVNRKNLIPEFGKIDGTNPCLSGDTWVTTNYGPKQIKDIVGIETELLYNGKLHKTTKEGFFKTGYKDVYEVILENGRTIKATSNHKFLVYNVGWTELKDITTKDSLVLSGGHNISKVMSIKYSNKEDVYDVCVPGVNAFDANGIIVHNCGEVTLLDNESCNLGSINLSNFVIDDGVDYDRLKEVVYTAIRFLDNCIDCSTFPDDIIAETTKRTRKLGLGIMGTADFFIKMNVAYGSPEANDVFDEVISALNYYAFDASARLAEEKGFLFTYNGDIKELEGVKIRNGSVTTVAPTGTVSRIAGCSSGIEPLFMVAYLSNIMDKQFIDINPLFEKALKDANIYSDKLIEKCLSATSIQNITEIPEDIRKLFVCAQDLTAEQHINVQAIAQKYITNSISKTINMPNSATKEQIRNALLLGWKSNLKGMTIYRDGSRQKQVLENKKEEVTKTKKRPDVINAKSYKTRVGCGNLYIQISDLDNKPYEVFSFLGKSGGCPSCNLEAISRLVSKIFKDTGDVKDVIHQLKNISCPNPSVVKGHTNTSCSDALAKIIELHTTNEIKRDAKEINNLPCPKCGGQLVMGSGCYECLSCGFSKCG